MSNSLEKFNENFSIPIAVIATAAGIVSIVKDTPWYIYSACFLATAILTLIIIITKSKINDFKIIWQEITLEIINKNGTLVNYKNESILKSCKRKSQEFNYSLFSDGNITDIKVSPGYIDGETIEAGEIYIRALTPTPINKGDQIKQKLTCKLHNSFTKNKEYWETTRYSPGTNIRIVLLFPNDRIFLECKAYKVLGLNKEFADKQPLSVTIEDKPALVFEIKQAKVSEKFRIEWSW